MAAPPPDPSVPAPSDTSVPPPSDTSAPPPSDPSVSPPYRPAPYLVSGPGAFLTAEELVRYFDDFYGSLDLVNTAPQMVFERLIGNLGGPVHAAIENARRAGASEGSGAGTTRFQKLAAAARPPVIPPPAIPARVVPSTTAVPTTNVEQEVCRTTSHMINSFTVDDCAEWDASSAFALNQDFLTAGKADLSRFAIALTSFQMPNSTHLIASASITAPQDTGFTVSLTNTGPSGYSSCLKSASCSWIALDECSIDMQCGTWTLPSPKDRTAHNITFPMRYNRYDDRPQVLVWLRGLHMLPFLDRSIQLNVTDGDSSGFTLCATSLSSTVQSIEFSWLACPAQRPGVQIGAFHSGQNYKDNNTPFYRHCEGYVAFESSRFKTPPKVVVGIMGFQIDKSVHLSLSVQVLQVTSKGMKWRIDGGPNGHFKSVTGSYIAIE